MIARILLTCLLLGVVVSATSDFVPGAVWKGYFPGRSGDVIVEDKGVASHDSFLLFLSQPEYQGKVEMSGIDETNVADLLAHLLGLPAINLGLDRASFPQVDYFNKPKANLLIILDSSADPAGFSLNGRRIEIRPEAYPNDPLARAYTLVSGSSPSHHGIIQRRWHDVNKNEVRAFSSWNPTASGSPRGTLIDMMNLAYAGKPLLFAASSDPHLARALAAKPYTLTDANTHAIHWSAQKKLFESAYLDHAAPIAVTERVLQHFLASQSLVSEGQYNVEHNSFNMRLSDGTEVIFDLSGKEEAAFFRELALSQILFQQLSESVAVSNLIKDRVPDFYSFAFTSVTDMERKYRVNPSAQAAIFHLLRTSIVKMHEEFSRVYETEVLAEVAFFSSAAPERMELIAETVQEALPSPLVLSDFAPQIYLADVADRTQACHLAQSVLAPLGVKAYCMPAYSTLESETLSAHSEAMRLVRRDNGSDDGPSSDDIAIFQIVLWTSVALILMTLGTYLCMTTLDASKDGILYNTITAAHPKSS